MPTGVTYKVIVKTGAKKNGGTDAKVYIYTLTAKEFLTSIHCGVI